MHTRAGFPSPALHGGTMTKDSVSRREFVELGAVVAGASLVGHRILTGAEPLTGTLGPASPSDRVRSQICAKAREMISKGAIGNLMLVEGWLGRNDPTGAWEYPPPPDLSLQNLDWDTWQGRVPKRPFDPKIFARWRSWKEYGTGVA